MTNFDKCFRIGSILIVLAFDLFLFGKCVTVYTIHFIYDNIHLIRTTSLDWIADIFISLIALSMQLCLRFYLKFIKNVQQSNELLSNKLIIFLIANHVSCLFSPLPEDSRSFIIPMSITCTLCPIIILFDHSGFYNFFEEKHPRLKTANLNIMKLIHQFHIKIANLFVKTNRIRPYSVIV